MLSLIPKDMPLASLLVIHGAGTLAQRVRSELLRSYSEIIYLVDSLPDGENQDYNINGTPLIVPSIDAISVRSGLREELHYVSTIGYKNLDLKKSAYRRVTQLPHVTPVNCIHPSAYIADTVQMGRGNIIFPGVVIEDDVHIGDDNVIWSNACICHEARIGSHNFLAAGSIVGGRSTLKDCIFSGFGSIVNDNIIVASNTFMASGTVLHRDAIQTHQRYCGVPGRRMNSKG